MLSDKDIKKSLKNRTLMDKKRKNSPLIKVKDAILIRTDKLTKKQVLTNHLFMKKCYLQLLMFPLI